MARFELHLGDCLEVLKTMPDSSVDAVVCDPPYGLSFMGRKWDYDVPEVAVWAECLRVLKPGGHLLAFAGTRTQHRMAVRIEDAGFEIRDMIAWVYGSGFPKSLDVSKAIDKAAGAEREVVGFDPVAAKRTPAVGTAAYGDYNGQTGEVTAPATDAARQWQGWGTALKPALEPITVARKPFRGTVAENVLKWGTGAINIDECRVQNQGGSGSIGQEKNDRGARQDELRRVRKADGALEVTGGEGEATGDVRPGVQVEGNDWCRKPTMEERSLDGWAGELSLPPCGRSEQGGQGASGEPKGSAGLGASACDGAGRWEAVEADRNGASHQRGEVGQQAGKPALNELVGALEGTSATGARGRGVEGGSGAFESSSGRWPANLIHDGSSEVLAGFPEAGAHGGKGVFVQHAWAGREATEQNIERSTGSAARFFYCAKASKRDRDDGLDGFAHANPGEMTGGRTEGSAGLNNPRAGYEPKPQGNHHPTVKPTDLMAYLCRLVTPPGGVVLDPFMGSGSTGKAAMLEGFHFIGIEREAEYLEIARARISAVAPEVLSADDLI